jgi:ATP-dependent helicase/nuclease subunit A
MIDLWLEEEDGQAVLVDYKTDRLPFEKAEAILKERYRIQINAYQEAIERATGRMVKERYIWLIREGRAIAL